MNVRVETVLLGLYSGDGIDRREMDFVVTGHCREDETVEGSHVLCVQFESVLSGVDDCRLDCDCERVVCL